MTCPPALFIVNCHSGWCGHFYFMTINRQALKLNDVSQDVQDMCAALAQLGYLSPDEVGRRFTTHVQAALEAFQRDNGIGETGVCDADTWRTLNKALADKG
jgi:hypothetical protein